MALGREWQRRIQCSAPRLQNAATAQANLAEILAAFGQMLAALSAEEIAMTQARSATSDGLVDAHGSQTYAVMLWRLDRPEAANATFLQAIDADRC